MDVLFASPSQEERPSFSLFSINCVFSIQRSLEEAEEYIERRLKKLQQYPETGAYKNIF